MSVLHLLDPRQYATDQQRAERLKICEGCEHLTKYSRQCKKCGCFVSAKTKLRRERCPVGKWGRIDQ